MLTLNLIFVYIVFTSNPTIQSSILYYHKYIVSEKCTSVEKPEPIKLTEADGGSAVYFELNRDKPSIKLTQTCVIVVQSPPDQGLVLHPVTLDLTRFFGKILIYQLHLSVKNSHTIYDLDGSIDSNDDRLGKSVPLNILPGDDETIVLFSFEPDSNETDWNQLSFEFLITSFNHTFDV